MNDPLVLFMTQLPFFIIFGFALRNYLRARTRPNLDSLLMLADIATIILLAQFATLLGVQLPKPAIILLVILLMALPYLLLRLLENFYVVRRLTRGIAVGGLILSSLAVIFVPLPFPPWFTLALVVYFVYVEGYASWRFFQLGRETVGITRRRLTAIASGALMLAISIALSAAAPAFPTLPITLLSRILSVGIALAWYVGFSPPRWLRHYWEFPELFRFLSTAASTLGTYAPDELLRQLAESAAQALGARGGAIGVYDERAQILDFGLTSPRDLEVRQTIVPLGHGISGRAALDRKPFFFSEPAFADDERSRQLREAGIENIMAAPILSGDKLLGVLTVYAGRGPIFVEEDIDILAQLAAQIGTLIEKVQLLGQTQAQIQQLTILQETGQALSATLALSDVLDTILDSLKGKLNFEYALISLVDEAAGEVRAVRGVGVTESWIQAARHGLDEPDIMADILRSGKTEVIRGWDPRFDRANFEAEQHAGLIRIFAPLVARDRTLGLLEAGRKADPAGLVTEDESRAVRILAQQAGLAIHNARLFEAIKLSESQLRAAMADLRIAEDELRRRERLATLGQLSGGIAHELRNPLAIIRNSSYLLAMTFKNVDEKTLRHLSTIDRQVDAANKIISDLLDLARSKPAERRVIETANVVHEAMTGAPVPGNIRVDVNLPPHLPPIEFDPTHLRQVLINLFTNAYQAMPDGGELSITSELNHDHILLYVRDTGIGIPEENLERIFLPLYSTKAKGIGLGLALAKQLAEANDGALTVTSTVGVGSTFTLSLPCAKGETLEKASQVIWTREVT